MVSSELLKKFYPDESLDGTSAFYGWVREYTSLKMRLLNLGAGPPTRDPRRVFRGEVAEVVGADIDSIVFENTELDRAVLIEDGQIPEADASFDVIVSDFTFEHVCEPDFFLREARRVLRPGGSLFFRTTNLRHYVATISRLTPHWFHTSVANRVRGLADDTHEPWKTAYHLNTPETLEKFAGKAGFQSVELRMCEAEPSYLVFATLPFLIGVAYERVVNRFDRLARFRASIFGRLVA